MWINKLSWLVTLHVFNVPVSGSLDTIAENTVLVFMSDCHLKTSKMTLLYCILFTFTLSSLLHTYSTHTRSSPLMWVGHVINFGAWNVNGHDIRHFWVKAWKQLHNLALPLLLLCHEKGINQRDLKPLWNTKKGHASYNAAFM